MQERLYNFIKKTFLILNYVFINVKIFFIKLYIYFTKNNWYLSKNRNFYNPTLAATVYKYGDTWKIARYGNYFGNFELKKEAMDSVLQIWLKDKNFINMLDKLECKLNDIKQKVLNRCSDYSDFSGEKLLSYNGKNNLSKKEIVDDVNFRAEYFYLAQTYTNCYRCGRSILVNAIILPEGFEGIDEYAIEDLQEEGISVENNIPFCSYDYFSIVSYLTYISSEALAQIYNHVSNYLFQKNIL